MIKNDKIITFVSQAFSLLPVKKKPAECRLDSAVVQLAVQIKISERGQGGASS